jgi:thiol:disulfide interchange protein
VTHALGVAIYGMPIAIVVPPMRDHRPTALCVLLAIALSCAFYYVPVLSRVSAGFVIIICSVTASALFALIRPIPEEQTEQNS